MSSLQKSRITPVFPPPLKAGGTIGIVSPGRWPKPEWIAKSKTLLEKRGYKVVIHPQNYLKDGQLAGSDVARGQAIMDMFLDPVIGAVLCARGGAGSLRLLDKLDYKRIGKNPKPFVGFSDITTLLHAISGQCGFATYHGPMCVNFAKDHHAHTAEDLFTVIGDRKKNIKLSFPNVDCARPGKAKGKLVGGNLSLLQSLIGTPYEWSGKDAILFIEDVDEVLYRMDRMLNHLRLAGKFKNVRAVLVGEMINVSDGETSFVHKGERAYGRSLKQIFMEHIPSHVPLCFNFPCGHGKYLTTLPVGAAVNLTLGDKTAELSFKV